MFGKTTKKPFHDIGRTPEAAEYLASQLERLMRLPLTTPAETETWEQECQSVQDTLKSQFPIFDPYHEIWHFFADADIRARDTGYRDYQHRLMSEYVQHLRHTNAA